MRLGFFGRIRWESARFVIGREFRYAGLCSTEQTEEDSPSGLWRTPGTRVGLTPSGVQIPYPPPNLMSWFIMKMMNQDIIFLPIKIP